MSDTVMGAAVPLLVCLLVAGPALAQKDQTEDLKVSNDPKPFKEEARAISYGGIGLSRVSADFQNVEDATNLELIVGLRVPYFSWISAEIDGSFTVLPGKNGAGANCRTIPATPPPPLGTGQPARTECEAGRFTRTTNEFQMSNIGLFGTVRTPGSLFLVGKYGYRLLNTSIPEIQESDDTDGTAWTAGAGFRWNQGLSGLELTYTDYSEDIDYYSLALAYGFGASPGRGAH